MSYEVSSFDQFVVVGDRVLIKPKSSSQKTKSGLYLPPNIEESEKVHSGYVIKTGPGYPIPSTEDDEPWKNNEEKNVKYLPLQALEGDHAIYLQKHAIDIEFNGEKYIIVPHASILMLIRDDGLFE